MNVACYPLCTGELPTRYLDGLRWVVQNQKCKCCGQYLPIMAKKGRKTKWEKVTGNVTFSLDDVRKKDLREYLTKAAKKLPKKYGNKGTLVVFFYAHDAKDHTQESLDNSDDWTVGIGYISGAFPKEDLADGRFKGAPKRITRNVSRI